MVHTLILLLDNIATHAPKQLENWLQEQARWNYSPLTIKVFWLPIHASWLTPIEIWFSVLQRKLLTPNHFNNPTELVQFHYGIYKVRKPFPKADLVDLHCSETGN